MRFQSNKRLLLYTDYIYCEAIYDSITYVQSIKKERTYELNSKFDKTYKYFFQSLITI